ncbi:hypothetical protein Aperf_G00000038372 [Anoplocephala perfoliata]
MSCHQCAKKLPVKAQQLYCPVCKFIMCKKCLCNTLPSQNSKNSKVCLQCYERVTKHLPDTDPRESDPPILFLRRMEELKNKNPQQPRPLPKKTEKADDTKKLTDRLNALTADERANLPTEAELQSRLDALSDFILTRKINTNFDGISKPKTAEDAVKDIIDQAKDEARLEVRHGISLSEEKGPDPERVYCSLCDNVATVTCPACMDEEFCNHCFLRAHKSKHMRCHESVPITK